MRDNMGLYRGKKMDNGEWVEGALIVHNEKAYIYPDEYFTAGMVGFCNVDPATVGQFTGLCDRNGKRIFDGDVCVDSRGLRFTVSWDDDNARFLGRGSGYIRYVGQEPAVEITGTIYDKEANDASKD